MQKTKRNPWYLRKAAIGAVISAIGSSLTTATVILSHDNSAWYVSTILLAGVTTLGVALGVHNANDTKEDSDE